MHELTFLITCENAFYAKDDKLNIIGIFDKVTVKKLPITHGGFSLALGIKGVENEVNATCSIIPPSKNKPIIINGKVPTPPEGSLAHLVINIQSFLLEEEGDYLIKLDIDGEEMSLKNRLKVIKE